MISFHFDYIMSLFITITYLTGWFCAFLSVFQARSPQGTMAWILVLCLLPFIGIPLFLLVGKKKLDNYDRFEPDISQMRKISDIDINKFIEPKSELRIFDNKYLVSGHEVSLLINGRNTFFEMLREIKKSKNYIFLQMYIFRTDKIGALFAEALIRKAKQGISIYILYERLGIKMSKQILRKMKAHGINLGEFSPIRLNKLQFNFRNHRKLLLIDGQIAFYGGINIGDDYLGRYPEIGHWRDTNIKVSGPVVGQSQLEFYKDWLFSQNLKMELKLIFPKKVGNDSVVLFNSGPSEEYSKNLFYHIEMISIAEKRLWIANPYFIPPPGIMDALAMASSRGVDVRIILPAKSDNPVIDYAAHIYIERLLKLGIRIFKYTKGMMHQKLMLIDDNFAVIGSSNLDYRSMFINFENMILTNQKEVLKDLDLATRDDFDDSVEVDILEFKKMSLLRKFLNHLANSAAPIL